MTPPRIATRPSPAPTTDQVSLPLDNYGFSADQVAAVDEAENLLVGKCMSAQGFTYTPNTVKVQSLPDLPPYGVNSLAQAEEYGYENPIAISDFKNLSSSPPASSAYEQAEQTCAAAANKRLGVTVGASADLVGDLASQAASYAQSDARVRQALRAWSACMAGKGYHYATPTAAEDAFPYRLMYGQTTVPTPSSAEVASAVADVECNQVTDMPGIWLAVEAGYERELIAQNEEALVAIRQQLDEAAQRAVGVVSSS